MKNILFIESPKERFGSSVSLLTLIDALDAERFKVHVAIHKDNELIKDLQQRSIEFLPLQLMEIKIGQASVVAERTNDPGRPAVANARFSGLAIFLRNLRDRFQFRHDIAALRRAILDWDINVVHLNNQISTNRFAYFAVPAGIPVVQHVRGGPVTPSLQSRSFAARVKAFICVSNFVKTEVVRGYSVEAGKCSVIYNPLPEKYFDANGKANEPRAEKQEGRVRAILVGRILKLKGQDLTLEALGLLRDENPQLFRSLRVEFVGASDVNNPYQRELMKRIQEDELEETVTISSYVTNIEDVYRQSDILIHFARVGEGFGRVVVEAMAAGCAVLVSNNGALPELVENGANGYVVDTTSALAKMLLRLLEDPDLLEKMQATAKLMAKQYRQDSIANEVMRIYDQLEVAS